MLILDLSLFLLRLPSKVIHSFLLQLKEGSLQEYYSTCLTYPSTSSLPSICSRSPLLFSSTSSTTRYHHLFSFIPSSSSPSSTFSFASPTSSPSSSHSSFFIRYKTIMNLL